MVPVKPVEGAAGKLIVPEDCLREVTSDAAAMFQTADASVNSRSVVPPESVEVPFQVPPNDVVTAAPSEDVRFPFTVVPGSKDSFTLVPEPVPDTSPFRTAEPMRKSPAVPPADAVVVPLITPSSSATR